MTLFMKATKMRRKTLSHTIIWPHNVIIQHFRRALIYSISKFTYSPVHFLSYIQIKGIGRICELNLNKIYPSWCYTVCTFFSLFLFILVPCILVLTKS